MRLLYLCENCCTHCWLDVCGSLNYDVITKWCNVQSEGGEICKAYFASFFVSNQYINGYGMQEELSKSGTRLLLPPCIAASHRYFNVGAVLVIWCCLWSQIIYVDCCACVAAKCNWAEANPERYANKNQWDLPDCLKWIHHNSNKSSKAMLQVNVILNWNVCGDRRI